MVKIIVIISLVVLTSSCASNFASEKVTYQGIKAIEVGMLVNEVIDTIGLPVEIKANWHIDIDLKGKPVIEKATSKEAVLNQLNKWQEDKTCCPERDEESKYRRYTFTYSRGVVGFRDYLMIWVHFDKELKVESVYVKRYEGGIGLEEFEMYSLSSQHKREDADFKTFFKQ